LSLYVDTSVLGAYYCPERLSEQAQEHLQSLAQIPVIGLLTEVELTSLVSKKRRSRELTEANARRVLMAFQAHLEEGYFQRCEMTAIDYFQARDLLATMKTSLTTLDTLHVALVRRHELELITADTLMGRMAQRLQIKTTVLSWTKTSAVTVK
jgi:predicted nucleic acid-binding protein